MARRIPLVTAEGLRVLEPPGEPTITVDSPRWAALASRERPRAVGQIAAATGLRQPSVSKHLSGLRGCGMVRAERSGRFVTYGMVDPGVEEFLGAVGALLLARVDESDESIEEYPIHDGSAR
jgi:DNA-binding transcriptional ArsR family regulator